MTEDPFLAQDPFLAHRGLFFTIAYEMLGSAADAEDVVQETWLRWDTVDQETIADPRAYLVRAVTRQALNRLRATKRQREEYVGEWLPEPLLTSPDVAEDVEFAENVSIAMLTVLETLGPAERAVFVLHDVFDTPFPEIAEALGKTPAAVRQIAHRARDHVKARRPRVRVDKAEQQRVVERFRDAVSSGDVTALMEVLAPDVVVIIDGGGVVAAARKPINGAEKAAWFLSQVARLFPGFTAATTWLNGMPGIRLVVAGEVTAASLDVEDGRITKIYAIRNPRKLAWLDKVSDLRKGKP
jgi:RNA polymerase sigma-70 factor (ECF subfamily)